MQNLRKTNPPPTRKYDNKLRLQKQGELKSRIAAATAELHASKGAAETSYADIARQAGVSLPTVYSHFPDEDELFRGCTLHAADHAPILPVSEILGASSLSTAIELLVDAMEQQHIYYEPWSSRRMEGYVTFLAEMSVQVREQQSALIEKIMRHFLGPGKRHNMIAGCETVLSFDFWHRLVRGHGLPRSQARQILIQSLQSILEPKPEPLSTSKPRRK